MSKLSTYLEKTPIIPAIRTKEHLDTALQGENRLLFFVDEKLSTIGDNVERVHQAGKHVYIHMDLMDGLRRDREGLLYLHQHCRVDGIISTHAGIIRTAVELKIPCIQRVFLLDSVSLSTGLDSIRRSKPDAVELMPGTLPPMIEYVANNCRLPVVVGGLVQSKDEIIASLGAGAVGVSTSTPELWQL